MAGVKTRASRHIAVILAAAACLCLCGCESVRDVTITGHLWNQSDYIVPSPEARLTLAQTPDGILVQYNSVTERNGEIHRHAYFLEANNQRIAAGKQPVFIDPATIQPQTTIPVFWRMPENQRLPNLCALGQTNLDEFVMYRDGKRGESYDLPVYNDKRKVAEKAALTPLAITGDATVVAAVVAYLWARGHAGCLGE